MYKALLLLTLALFTSGEVNATNTAETHSYLTAIPKEQGANPIKLVDVGNTSDTLLQLTTQGPLANTFLQVDSKAGGGFLRVDNEDRKLYAFSRINASTPVDIKQASRFQVVVLSDYEAKLYKLRPTNKDKDLWLASDVDKTKIKERFLNILQTYLDLTKELLTDDDTDLLVGEVNNFVKFITQGTEVKHQQFFNEFKKETVLVNKLLAIIEALKTLLKTPAATQMLQNSIQSWQFGYNTLIPGLPSNNNIVVIKSEKDPLKPTYLTIVKEKDLSGKDVYYLAFSATDIVSAAQFQVQEIGGRLGFTCVDNDGKDLVITSLKPIIESNIATIQRKITRLTLQPKNATLAFGLPGSEKIQFQAIEQSPYDANYPLIAAKFFIQSLNFDDQSVGFWMIDENDESMLRVMDPSKNPITRQANPSQYFSFINISDSQAFYNKLRLARKEMDLLNRFTMYVDTLSTVSNTLLATVLLQEMKLFMGENKKAMDSWQTFLRILEDPFNAFITTFQTMFAEELKQAEGTVSLTLKAVQEYFKEPFVEELIDGSLYAIAWINEQNEQKFLTLEPETENLPNNYSTMFKVVANGDDQFDPAAQFKFIVDKTQKTIQIESSYQKDVILGKDLNDKVDGPNDHLPSGEASFSCVRLCFNAKLAASGGLQDVENKPEPVTYLRVLGWREKQTANSNPLPNSIFKFKYEGSFNSMNFKSVFADGFLNVDPATGLISAIDVNNNETPYDAAGINGRFAIITISPLQQKLAAARNYPTINEQADAYIRLIEKIDAQTESQFRSQFLEEVYKFIRSITLDPKEYDEAKAISNKINSLIGAVNDTKPVAISTKTKAKAADIKKLWDAGFSGAFENGGSYALSLVESADSTKVLRAFKANQDKDEFALRAVPVKGQQDLMNPYSKFLVHLDEQDNAIVSLELADSNNPGVVKTYYLANNDDAVNKKRNGLTFQINKDKAQVFKVARNSDGKLALKDLRDSYGFITVDSTDIEPKTKITDLIGMRSVSSLSELNNSAAGNKTSKGLLTPSFAAQFEKFTFSPVHVKLSNCRLLEDHVARLAIYLEVANYTDLKDEQKDSLASEFAYWIEQILQNKTLYEALSVNQTFTSKLLLLLDQIKKSLASDSAFNNRLSQAKELWQAGFIGQTNSLIPANGSKVLLQVILKDLQITTTDPYMPVFLHAVDDDTLKKTVLKADAYNPLDNSCVFQINTRGERVGFKSETKDNRFLFQQPLPTDQDELKSLQELSLQKRLEEMALYFVDATSANFSSNSPTGAQFVLDNIEPLSNKAILASIREMTSQGSLKIDTDMVARAINYEGLTPNTKPLKINILPVGAMYETALKIVGDSDLKQQITDFKTLVRQTKPATYDRLIFEQAFNQVFANQKTKELTAVRGAENTIELAITEWNLKDKDAYKNDASIKRMKATAALNLPKGTDFAKKLTALIKSTVAGSKDRVTDLKALIKDYIVAYWQRAIITEWTDLDIVKELKLNETKILEYQDKIIGQRLLALSNMVAGFDLLTKQEKTTPIGFKEAYAPILAQQKSFAAERKSLVAARALAQGTTPLATLAAQAAANNAARANARR